MPNPKAYENLKFLNSYDARPIRILSEYLEPQQHFKENNIRHTVVFFGSARTTPQGDKMSQSYHAAEEFAYRLAKWSSTLNEKNKLYICTGGGPGIMEAANKGASRAGEKNLGLNISLPFEQHSNPYITPELNMEFHYFYMRKLWFLYYAKALVVFPGGFGTMDELFETLTLVQTEKVVKKNLSILLFDREFWKQTINFDYMVECGLISPEDLDLFRYFDSPEEGMQILQPRLEKAIRNFEDREI